MIGPEESNGDRLRSEATAQRDPFELRTIYDSRSPRCRSAMAKRIRPELACQASKELSSRSVSVFSVRGGSLIRSDRPLESPAAVNLTRAIPAGSYFALIRAEEQDVSLLGEVDGRASIGEGPILLAAPPYAVQDFEFSPSGERLFCTLKDIRRGPDDLVLAVCDSNGRMQKFDGYSQVFASWVRDGSRLLVRSSSSLGERPQVSLLDVTTGAMDTLETPADMFFKHDVYDPEFLVSFKRLADGDLAVNYLDAAGSERELLREKNEIRELRFSPDRTKVAYFYSYPYHKWLSGWRVVVVDVATRGRTTVFDGVAESIFRLRWAPDSQGLLFVASLLGIPENRLMDMDMYETMGGYAPDLIGNAYVTFSMKMDGSDRREVARDCWKFDWISIPDFEPALVAD